MPGADSTCILIVSMHPRIGTSGWHYPSGRGTWNGIFYPGPRDRGRGFDELAFYAERFNTVEINATFYGQPRANVTGGWVRRTPPGFDFAVKLYQKFTHPTLAGDRTAISAADVDQFKTRHRAARHRRSPGPAPRAVSPEFQGLTRIARAPGMAAEDLRRL